MSRVQSSFLICEPDIIYMSANTNSEQEVTRVSALLRLLADRTFDRDPLLLDKLCESSEIKGGTVANTPRNQRNAALLQKSETNRSGVQVSGDDGRRSKEEVTYMDSTAGGRSDTSKGEPN